MTTPQPNQFLVQPINAFDLIVVYRGSDVSRPLYMTYKDLLAILTAAISGGGTSGLLLQTNSVTNPIQDVLNILEGTGMSIVDNGDGSVTFNATGGGSVTADNGLMETAGNVQLGGTLLQNTTVNGTSAYTMYFTGARTGLTNFTLDTRNTSANGSGAYIQTNAGIGQAIRTTSGNVLNLKSDTGILIDGSTSGDGLSFDVDGKGFNILQGAFSYLENKNGTPNTVERSLLITKTGNNSVAGSGMALDISAGDSDAGNNPVTARIATVYTDPTDGAEQAETQLYNIQTGVLTKAFSLKQGGKAQFHQYGSGTQTGTKTFDAAFDASGNLIEVTSSGGGGSLLNDTTGILFGGALSATIGGTTFSVTEGIGQIVTQTASISGVATTVTNVTWSAVTGAAITNIGTSQFTYVLVNSSGVVIQQTTPFTDAQYKTHIIIGILCHIDLASVNLVTNAQNVAYEDPHRLVELIDAFGPVKKSGLNIGANGANLRVNRTSGEAFKIGSNYITDQFEPDVRTVAAQTPALLCRVHRDGSGGFIFDVNGGSYYNDIDPSNYDDGSGTLQSVGGSKWTIQRLFFFPNNPADIICYYGTQVYNQFSEARANLEFETFDEAQITAENAVFLGYLFVRNAATDLSDPNEAAFLQSGLFRGIPAGGGGSGGGAVWGGITGTLSDQTDLQTALDGKVDENAAITGDTKTKITYDAKGLVTAGTDAAIADITGLQTELDFLNSSAYPYVKRQYLGGNAAGAIVKVPTANRLFIGNTTGNNVFSIDSLTGALLFTTTINGVTGLVYVPVGVSGGEEVWGFNATTTIWRFNALTGALLGSLGTPSLTTSCKGLVYVSGSPNRVYAFNATTMSVINASSQALIANIAITGSTTGSYELIYVSSGVHSGLVVGVSNNGIFAVDTTTNTVAIAATNFAASIAASFSVKHVPSLDVYVLCAATLNRVAIITPTASPYGFTLTQLIFGMIRPTSVQIDDVDQIAYVATWAGQANTNIIITVIDLLTYETLRARPISSLQNTTSYTQIDTVNKYIYVLGSTGVSSVDLLVYKP